jgi:membrane fusion protein (multidrug efflux system)
MRTQTVSQPRRSTVKRMIIMLVIVGLIFGGIFGFKWFGNKMMNQFMDNMPVPPAAITVAEARVERWTESLEAIGTLTAVNGTDVTTESAGVVGAIRFESGQAVKKGDVLLQLDASTETATLRSLEAGLNLAVTQRDRFRDLFERNQAVAKADLDQRESEAAQLQANVNAQRALIARKTIRAPFDGVLGIRKVNLGQFLNPGDPIVSLQSMDPIYINFSLPEQRLGAVQVGQEVDVTVDSLPGRSFTGTVTAIEPQVDASTRNFMLQATIGNAEAILRPGTFARASAKVGESADAVVIPQTAVSFNPYGNTVYVVSESAAPTGQAAAPVEVRADDESPSAPADPAAPPAGPQLTVKQRFITTGATRGDLVVVTDGLEVGERVATSGLLKLRNDAVVVINDEVEPTSDERPTPDNR